MLRVVQSRTCICICLWVLPGIHMHFWKEVQKLVPGKGVERPEQGGEEGGELCNFAFGILSILCLVLGLPVQILDKIKRWNKKEIETERVRDKGIGKRGREERESLTLFNPGGPKFLMPLFFQEKAPSCPLLPKSEARTLFAASSHPPVLMPLSPKFSP